LGNLKEHHVSRLRLGPCQQFQIRVGQFEIIVACEVGLGRREVRIRYSLEALSRYTRRWAVEVDHLYLKLRLGLGDFRLRRYEGVTNDSSCWRAILLFLFHLLGETPQTKINIVTAASFLPDAGFGNQRFDHIHGDCLGPVR